MPTGAVAVAPTIAGEKSAADQTSLERPVDCLACSAVAYIVLVSAQQDTYFLRRIACRPFRGTAYPAASGRLAGADEKLVTEMDEVAGPA